MSCPLDSQSCVCFEKSFQFVGHILAASSVLISLRWEIHVAQGIDSESELEFKNFLLQRGKVLQIIPGKRIRAAVMVHTFSHWPNVGRQVNGAVRKDHCHAHQIGSDQSVWIRTTVCIHCWIYCSLCLHCKECSLSRVMFDKNTDSSDWSVCIYSILSLPT